MKLAILFWFYKDASLCLNRLQVLRKYNPDTPIFGLYGGDINQTEEFRSALGAYLDDFYAYSKDKDAQWKWRNGDLMIAQWQRDRGKDLAWDTIVIAQWDMLIIGAVENLFPSLKQDEVLLSGLRPVKEVENWWWWLRQNSAERQEYFEFLEYIKASHPYHDEPLCCEFIVACLSKKFLDKYAQIPDAELGFLEYKLPIYAQIFGIPFCTAHPYNPWWADDPATRSLPLRAKILNADVYEVSLRMVFSHLLSGSGARIFHPYFRTYPLSFTKRLRSITREMVEEEIKPRWRRWMGRLTSL